MPPMPRSSHTLRRLSHMYAAMSLAIMVWLVARFGFQRLQMLAFLHDLNGRERITSAKKLCAFTPRTACQMLAVTVLYVDRARNERIRCFFQCILPGLRI